MSHFASAMRHFLAVSVTHTNSGALIVILLHHILCKSCLSVVFKIVFVFILGTMGDTEQKLRLLSNSPSILATKLGASKLDRLFMSTA